MKIEKKLDSLSLPDGKNRMILRSLVLTHYQRLTDKQAACGCDKVIEKVVWLQTCYLRQRRR